MKQLLFFFLVFQSICIAQHIDTNCYHSRWIQLSPNSINNPVFCLDSNVYRNNDFISFIKKAVEEKKLNIYRLIYLDDGSTEWQYIDYEDELKTAESVSSNSIGWKPYFTRKGPVPDFPLTNEEGDPIIIEDETGILSYVYPPREIFELHTTDLTNIVIKEVKSTDVSGLPEYRISDIGFYLKEAENKRSLPLFWIDFQELTEIIPDSDSYPWYYSLSEQNYAGPAIRQIPCSEMEINSKEDKHPKLLPISDSCSCNITMDLIREGNDFVIKIPDKCGKGVNVYFGEGGTQTDISILKVVGSTTTNYIGGLSFVNSGDKNFISVREEMQLLVLYRPCHFRKEFKIFVE